MAIKIKDWLFRKEEILKIYRENGFEKAREFYITSGVNLMAAYYLIKEEYPESGLEKELDRLLDWYGETIDTV